MVRLRPRSARRARSCAAREIAGFVHIGRPAKPPEDRPRPPLADIVTRFYAIAPEDLHVLRPARTTTACPTTRSRRSSRRARSAGSRRSSAKGGSTSRPTPSSTPSRPPPIGDVRQRGPQGFGRLHRRDRRVRLQSRDLGFARGDERTSAPLPRGVNEMDAAGLEPAPSPAGAAAARAAAPCALECKARTIAPLDDLGGKPADGTWCSARSSASTSTSASSATACSTPPP